MRKAILFAFAAQAFANLEDSNDNFVDNLVDRALEESPLHHADVDNTVLGKSTHYVAPRAPTKTFSRTPVAPSRFQPTLPQVGGFRQVPNVVAQGMSQPAVPAAVRRPSASRSWVVARDSPKTSKAVDTENCDPEKMVCTSDAGDPHGGELINNYVKDEAERTKLVSKCSATIELSERQACDVMLLITGAFSPLTGFMKKADYDSVVSSMRLAGGTLFGLPVVLDIADGDLQGKKVMLKYQGKDLAVLDAEEEWQPDKAKEAKECYGTDSTEHPTVAELQNDLGKFYVGGRIYGLVKGFDAIWGKGFKTPAEVRATLPEGKQVVAFQNRNPVHKAHFELLVNAKEDIPNSIVFVHPTCGPTQPGDIDGATRIKTYEVLQDDPFYQKWAEDRFRWSYLPYSMKMAGPREAIQHMIIRKNFGATHFIIGRDMAGTKSTVTGDDFYGPFDAQEIGEKYGPELAMKVAKYPNMVYVGEENGNARGFATEQDAKDKGLSISKLSGTKFRDALRNGEDVPDWFAFPAVVKTLQEGGDKIFIPGR